MGDCVAVQHPDLEGWAYEPQLAWLRERASVRHRVLEVGAWKGRTTAVLADATLGHVWVVDCWDSTDPEDEATEFIAQDGREGVLDAFLENMRPWSAKLTILNMDWREAWKRLSHLAFDMVYLDADHRYEEVREQIVKWRALLAPGGLLCGHDGEHGGVRRAVDELIPDAQFHATPQQQGYPDSLIWYAP